MKRNGVCVCALSLLALASCGGSSGYKVPTNAYEKVTTAFQGVEKSFKDLKTESGFAPKKRFGKVKPSNLDGALADIAALYGSGDSLGDAIDELSFNEPPMVQLQCLKKAVEKIGDGYAFGSKYYNTIKGVIYYDAESGKKSEENPAYRYDYDFILSIQIDLNDDDVIEAEVSFDITLKQGDTTYHTDWYVSMELAYQMEKESPNYTLAMYTVNNEEELPVMEYGNVYEYDYVDVRNGAIHEWRKLGYETSVPMIKDNDHTRFEDYLNDGGFAVRTSVSRWYKNADLKRFAKDTKEKTNALSAALFNKLNLNVTDSGKAAFEGKDGIKHDAILTLYQEFSALKKEDLIYDLIETGDHEQPKEAAGIVITNSGGQVIGSMQVDEDFKIWSLFDEKYGDGFRIYHVDDNGNLMGDFIRDLSQFEFSITLGQASVFTQNVLDRDYSSFFIELGEDSLFLSGAKLTVKEKATNFAWDIDLSHGDTIKEIVKKALYGTFPKALTDMGFIAYKGEDPLFYYDGTGDIKHLFIDRTNTKERAAYFNQLEIAGYAIKEIFFDEHGIGIDRIEARKAIDEEKALLVYSQAADIANGGITIHYAIVDIEKQPGDSWEDWPTQTIFEQSGNMIYMLAPSTQNGYYIHDATNKTIEFYDFTDEEFENLILNMKSLGEGGYGDNYLTLLKEGNKLARFEIVRDENDEHKKITFHYGDPIVMERYFISLGEDSPMYISDDYTFYYMYRRYEAGVYGLRALVPSTGEQYNLSIAGAGGESYENVRYNAEDKTITLLETQDVCITVPVESSPKQGTLVSFKEAKERGIPYSSVK